MPRKKTSDPSATALAVATPTKSMTLLDQELQKEAELVKQAVGAPSSNKIKLEPSGHFRAPDGSDLGDEITVVVVDFMNRNFFYSKPYSADEVSLPDCYAIDYDRSPGTMKPEDDSPDKQSEICAACPMNQFGSGSNGKSKACQNRYWLAVLLVDPENPEGINDPSAPLHLIDVSPSNRRGFDRFVASCARSLAGPPIKARVTMIGESMGTYAKLDFVDMEANPDYAIHASRREEARDIVTRRPDFTRESAPPPKAAARRPAHRTTARRA